MEATLDPAKLTERAEQWMAGDPDEGTRQAMRGLLERKQWAEIASCLTPLTFGTAGLRGLEGPGPGRMNRAVVVRTTRGLADYLLQFQPPGDPRPIVVGADARKNSMLYQRDVVAVLVAAGFFVRFFETSVPTPLVAYAARVLGARAAICITASHNPSEYAGFKLYAENAVQIVAPVDERVANAIDKVGAANRVKLADSEALVEGALPVPPSVDTGYLDALDGLRVSTSSDRDFPIVYTPLHGVGGTTAMRALRRAGYEHVHIVPEQADPDPDFPTVAFPNPEEEGALDLASALAEELGAEVVLANDPDADRLAACIRDGEGPIRALTGNQLGLLLADYLLRHHQLEARPLVVSSIVSSPMIEDIAEHYGAACLRTLTGFKWMLNAALEEQARSGARFVFGFEEALGYCVGQAVRDKDGISAAVVFADLAAECRAHGSQVGERLGELYSRHGLWASALVNLVPEPEVLARTHERLTELSTQPPSSLAGLSVSEVVDFNQGAEMRPWYLGATDLVELRLAGRARVVVRPSGTEPKLKIYADYRVDYQAGEERRQQEIRAASRARELAMALSERLAGE